MKCILDVNYFGRVRAVDDPHYIESEGVSRLPPPEHPIPGGVSHFPLLAPVHRAKWAAEQAGNPCLDLDEYYESPVEPHPLDYEIDIAVAAPETAVEHPPSAAHEVILSEPLTAFSQDLPGSRHEPNVRLPIPGASPFAIECNPFVAGLLLGHGGTEARRKAEETHLPPRPPRPQRTTLPRRGLS